MIVKSDNLIEPDKNTTFFVSKNTSNTLHKIFDIKIKPVISDKEFIQLSQDSTLQKYILFKCTKSGFVCITKQGHYVEETSADETSEQVLTAGTHKNHSGKRDGLDVHFVANMREIFTQLGITPETITTK